MSASPSATWQGTCIRTTARWRTFLPEVQEAFVQILLVARQVGALDLGVVSQDGTKIHADASKSQAVSAPAFTTGIKQ